VTIHSTKKNSITCTKEKKEKSIMLIQKKKSDKLKRQIRKEIIM
jgi:hypothetical protein